jgi:hypothetical protein
VVAPPGVETIPAIAAADGDPAVVAASLADARAAWVERGEAVVEVGGWYTDGEPVRVVARKRGSRVDLSDGNAAVRLAGRPPGWLAAAEAGVDEYALNVNRAGVVFVPAFEWRDLEALALGVAAASRAVYAALLDRDDGRGRPTG